MSVTVSTLQKLKDEHKKFATITAYDATFAHLFDEAGISAILIGDSLGMTMQGRESTLGVTIDDMAYHTACVKRGTRNALILADMPFMTYHDTASACENAARLMRAGANVVKLEGGAFLCSTIETLVNNGVPVCGHLGLTPQSVNVFGGYKVQGRGDDAGKHLLDDCLAVQNAGASMLVLECVPRDLAAHITEQLRIPVIGIGAGNQTDGQILVMQDALGLTVGHTPKFAFNFLKETGNVIDAVKLYISKVESGEYPAAEQSFA
jgi:3-methyl-2-oxobutanoate hydroxymethyltransferase